MPNSPAASLKLPSLAAASKAVKARSGGRSRLAKILHQWDSRGLHSIPDFHKVRQISILKGEYYSPQPQNLKPLQNSTKLAHWLVNSGA